MTCDTIVPSLVMSKWPGVGCLSRYSRTFWGFIWYLTGKSDGLSHDIWSLTGMSTKWEISINMSMYVFDNNSRWCRIPVPFIDIPVLTQFSNHDLMIQIALYNDVHEKQSKIKTNYKYNCKFFTFQEWCEIMSNDSEDCVLWRSTPPEWSGHGVSPLSRCQGQRQLGFLFE